MQARRRQNTAAKSASKTVNLNAFIPAFEHMLATRRWIGKQAEKIMLMADFTRIERRYLKRLGAKMDNFASHLAAPFDINM
jgi:hypothetical protein